jgi:16S rRNA (cytidine1402-2'-O)-methyltransferase
VFTRFARGGLGREGATRNKDVGNIKRMAQTPISIGHKSKRGNGLAQSGAPTLSLKLLLENGLFLVATPIGNLGDFSPRAQKTLENADLILAEDTRMTRKLMGLHGIVGRVIRCDEAATSQGLAAALEVLSHGGAVAFCSDAGTPGVSDPGERLSRGVIEAGYPVRAVPGASAAITALTISGLPSTQFMFAGFTPAKEGPRSTFLSDLAMIKATLIFFETGPRLAASLASMHAILGDRPACVARELTKMYEETRRGSLRELAAFYHGAGAPKGEIVVVVGGAPDSNQEIDEDRLDTMIAAAMVSHHVKDAAQFVATRTGLPKRDIYARALALREKSKVG